MDSNTSTFIFQKKQWKTRVNTWSQRFKLTFWFDDENQDNEYTKTETTRRNTGWIRRKTEDGVWFLQICLFGPTGDQDSLDFAEAAKHLASGLANEYLSQGNLPCEIRWYRLWTSEQDSIWMLEKWRIWWRINCQTFWVREQVRDEDVSTMKEKMRANVATKRKTKPNQSLLLYYDIVQFARLVPLQDDGDKPMMDLA